MSTCCGTLVPPLREDCRAPRTARVLVVKLRSIVDLNLAEGLLRGMTVGRSPLQGGFPKRQQSRAALADAAALAPAPYLPSSSKDAARSAVMSRVDGLLESSDAPLVRCGRRGRRNRNSGISQRAANAHHFQHCQLLHIFLQHGTWFRLLAWLVPVRLDFEWIPRQRSNSAADAELFLLSLAHLPG